MKRTNPRPAKSQYCGVTWDRYFNEWKARITLPTGERKHLGRFKDEILAAKAYDDAVAIYYRRETNASGIHSIGFV